MKTEYWILRADDPSDLISAVQTHVDDRWETVGGVAVSQYQAIGGYGDRETRTLWAQAIVRHSPDAVGTGGSD